MTRPAHPSAREGRSQPAWRDSGAEHRLSLPAETLTRARHSTSIGLLFLGSVVALVSVWATVSAGADYLLAFSLVASHVVIVAALVLSIQATGDLLNPLSIFLGVALVRFSLQLLIVHLASYSHQYPLFGVMGLTPESWKLGYLLVQAGLLSFVVGYLLAGRARDRKPLSLERRGASSFVYGGGMVFGVISLIVFVGTNAGSVFATVSGGTFRAVTIQTGTGKFFLLGLLLISSSVLLTGTRIDQGRPIWAALAPVGFASAVFFTLGGRARAVVPLVAGLLILWYRRMGKRNWRRLPLPSLIALLIAGIMFLSWVGNFGQQYRAGGGLGALDDSLSPGATVEYVERAVISEIGHLHAVAGAARLQPGALGGQTFLYSLLWPISDLIGISGLSSGIYVVQRLTPDREAQWGLHPTLIGDSYLNFGTAGVIVVLLILGYGIGMLYRRFREGRMRLALYVLTLMYSLRVFLESVDKWTELVIVMTFAVVLLWTARTTTSTRLTKAS